jgi:hypothetical protein
MVTAREPDADVYNFSSWQGGIQAASHWGTMRWGQQAANQTAKIVEKTGPAWNRNISCGDVHFKGAVGGSLEAFADGRGCGWAGHVPLQRQKGLTWQCLSSHAWCSKRWRNASEAAVWCSGLWANLGFKVAASSTSAASGDSNSTNVATTVNLTFGSGGNQMAFGPLWPGVCHEFFVEGVIEALSAPGEFYHNRAEGLLFLVPEIASQPPEAVVAVTTETLLRFAGSQRAPVRGITLSGLTFRGATKTFLGPHISTTNGADWAVPRSAAVEFAGVEGITVDRCNFDTLGGSAVLLSGYVRNATISNSEFSWLGGNGVLAIGDDDMGDATSGDYPLNTTIDRCVFRELGVYAKHSAAYAEFVAGAAAITHSIIFNMPRAGIALNDAMGGGNRISSNLIFQTVRESSDHGPINSWDRQAYLTLDPATGRARSATSEVTENEIARNFIMAGTGESTYPIDHDDCSACYYDHHNVLLFGPAKQWGGHSKRAVDNLQIWPDFGAGQYGRAACYDYQATGAYDEVFANNTCILSGYLAQPWCNSTGCAVVTLRDVCPANCSAGLAAKTTGLTAANNTYYVPTGSLASWRSSDSSGGVDPSGSCALSLSAVQTSYVEKQSRALDVASLSTDEVLAWVKTLLWTS